MVPTPVVASRKWSNFEVTSQLVFKELTVQTTDFVMVETPWGGFHFLSGFSRLIVGGVSTF